MSTNTNKDNLQDDEIDLIVLVNALWKKKWFILLTTLVFFTASIFYTRLAEKVYSSDALIQIDEKSDLGSSFLAEISPGFDAAGIAQHGKENLIDSRLILGKTVDAFHLQTQISRVLPLRVGTLLTPPQNVPRSLIDVRLSVPETYIRSEKPPKLRLILGKASTYQLYLDDQLLIDGINGKTTSKQGYTINVTFDESLQGRQFYLNKVSRLDAINQLAKQLSISEKKKGSGLYQLVLTGKDPLYIEKLLDNITENFIKENQLVTRESAQQSIDFIESQLPQLRKELTEAEDKLNSYMEKHGAVNLPVESVSTIKSLAEIEGQITALKLKEDVLAQNYTKAHPEYRALLRQKASLLARKKTISKELQATPSTHRGVVRLERNVEVNQKIYLQLLMKLQEIKVMAASNSGGVRIIDKAISEGTIIKPKMKLIVLIASLLGGMLGCGLVLISTLLRKVITSVDDITDYIALPVIGVVPLSKRQNNLKRRVLNSKKPLAEHAILAHSDADDLSIEALRGVCTSLHFKLGEESNNVIMISGPTENVGKSFVSVNLAVLFAELGKKVVFLDADFRKSYLNKNLFPEEGKIDIDKWLNSDEQDIRRVIHTTDIENFYVIRQSGRPTSKSSNLVMGNKFKQLLTSLSQAFDIVVLDTPPILPIIDSVILAKYATQVILVVKAEQSDVRELELSINKLEDNDIRVDATILNSVKKNKRYGSYYGYGKY